MVSWMAKDYPTEYNCWAAVVQTVGHWCAKDRRMKGRGWCVEKRKKKVFCKVFSIRNLWKSYKVEYLCKWKSFFKIRPFPVLKSLGRNVKMQVAGRNGVFLKPWCGRGEVWRLLWETETPWGHENLHGPMGLLQSVFCNVVSYCME